MTAVLRLARHDLRRAWVRNLLSALAIALGAATLVAAEQISQSVTAEINRTAESEAITAFMTEQLNVGLTVVGLVVTAGAAFVAFNAFSMSVGQRREDFGRLRAVGMTPQQITAMVLAEAAAVGLLGGLAGALGGVALSRGLVAIVQATSEMFNRFGQGQISVGRLAWAAALGMVVALLAAVPPARRAARVSPLAALRSAAPSGIARPSTGAAATALLLSLGLWTWLALDPPGGWIEPPWADRLSAALAALWLICLGLLTPALIDLTGGLVRRPLASVLGASGRLASDNLRRARGRVAATVLTLAVGVAMIVSVTGYMTYWFEELFFRNAETGLQENSGFGFFPIDINQGLQAYTGITSFTMPDGLPSRLEAAVAGRAALLETYFVLAPELSFLGERYFSYILDFDSVRRSGGLMFSFAEGDWDQAAAMAEDGCAVLLTRGVAARNGASLGDRITLATPSGPLDCRVAGIGPTFVGASIISDAAIASYGLAAPVAVTVFPERGVDREALRQDLQAVADETPGVWLLDLTVMTDMQREGMKSIQVVMDGMLLLAVVAAALGVVNTVALGTSERRPEFVVLHAAGATSAQRQTVVVAEGMLIGLLGAVLGLLAGVGIVVIYVVVSAGTPFGFPDFPAWPAAIESARPALGRGLVALIAAPILTATAAWMAGRRSVEIYPGRAKTAVKQPRFPA